MRLAALLLLAGCAHQECSRLRWGYSGTEVRYPVGALETSPEGIRFDDSGQAVAGELLDRLTDEVGVCLRMSIDRSSFVVKVPADWQKSCDGSDQLLSSPAPDAGCNAKGQPMDPACPCRWRAVIQCPSTIVITPNARLYKDALIRWVTGSQNPWASPELAKCAMPDGPLLVGGT